MQSESWWQELEYKTGTRFGQTVENSHYDISLHTFLRFSSYWLTLYWPHSPKQVHWPMRSSFVILPSLQFLATFVYTAIIITYYLSELSFFIVIRKKKRWFKFGNVEVKKRKAARIYLVDHSCYWHTILGIGFHIFKYD